METFPAFVFVCKIPFYCLFLWLFPMSSLYINWTWGLFATVQNALLTFTAVSFCINSSLFDLSNTVKELASLPLGGPAQLWVTARVEQQLLKLHKKKTGMSPKRMHMTVSACGSFKAALVSEEDDLSPVRRTPLLSLLESALTAEAISQRSPALKLEELLKIQTCRQKYILQTGGEAQRSPCGTSVLWYLISLEASPRVGSSCLISFTWTHPTPHTQSQGWAALCY